MTDILHALDAVLSRLDGVAGIAAFVNGLLLWPIVRTLKADHAHHDTRISSLERK